MLLSSLLLQLAVASPAAARTPDHHVTPSSAGSSAVQERSSREPARASRAPRIDGRDDDDVWQAMPPITTFRQFDPTEDGEPTFRTEARIAYDERNLYVLVRALDPRPDSILTVLQRRDGNALADDIVVGVDSYHDKRTGYLFRLTAAGTMADAYVFNDGEEDWGWNAVWEGAVHRDSLGWMAEYRIPLSQLRYVPSGNNTFGLAIWRQVARKGERVVYPLIRRSLTGKVSQWASTPGFRGLAAPRRMELMPYSVARYGSSPRGDGSPRNAATSQVGADLKLGLTSNVTLDAAVNPDFGQVEADPGVLNLTAFEQFFAERRPFFLEGAGIFRYDIDCNGGDCTGLFYSRRIGRVPQLRGRYGDAASPLQSRLLGAAKVTGRLNRGLSIGLIDAVTGRAEGTQSRTIEPQTNYAVVRLQQDLRGGNSGVGLMLTNTARQMDAWTRSILRENAWSGGLDARHRFGGNRWQVSGQVAGSRVTGSPQAIALTQRSNVHLYQRPDAGHLTYDSTRVALTGWLGQGSLDKQGGGITRMNLSAWYMTPGFEINDLGFRQRSDEMGVSGWFGLRPVRQIAIFRQGGLDFGSWSVANTSGMQIGNGASISGSGQLRNFWNVNAGVGLNNAGGVRSDRDSRGGPAMHRPQTVAGWMGGSGDRRRSLYPFMNAFGERRTDGFGNHWNVSAGVEVRVGTQFNGSVRTGYSRNIDDQQWIGNYVDTGVTSYTFARLYQSTSSITMRLNYTITPTLSVESYLQPFVSTGQYTDWRALADGTSPDRDRRFRPYAVRGAPGGFRVGQLRTNNVVRWEYRPGSVLFLVWTQARDAADGDPSQFGVSRGYSDVFGRRPENVFLVKASYWLGR